MNVVSSSTSQGAPVAKSCVATNCREPAKTIADIAWAAPRGRPAPIASAP